LWHERTDHARDTNRGFRERLRKAYGEKVVLDGIDLSIGEGEARSSHCPGPGRRGQDHTVQILSTLLPADARTASVMGHDLRGEADAVQTSTSIRPRRSGPSTAPICFGGITVLHAEGAVAAGPAVTPYRQDGEPVPPEQTTNITFIPYFAWATRGPHAMRVWIPTL
jgi:hypothetical protein